MKAMRFKQICTALLAALMLAACAVGLILPSSAAEVSVQNGTGTRGAVAVNGYYAYRAIVNGEFTAFSFSMPTWTTKTDGNT